MQDVAERASNTYGFWVVWACCRSWMEFGEKQRKTTWVTYRTGAKARMRWAWRIPETSDLDRHTFWTMYSSILEVLETSTRLRGRPRCSTQIRTKNRRAKSQEKGVSGGIEIKASGIFETPPQVASEYGMASVGGKKHRLEFGVLGVRQSWGRRPRHRRYPAQGRAQVRVPGPERFLQFFCCVTA